MPPLHPHLAPARLATLAEIADHRFDAAPGPGHCLLRVCLLDDEVELGSLTLAAGRHPVDAMAGLVAPADWWAVGAAATGTAHRGDRAVRVRTVHLVGRDGSWASRWSPLDDDPTAGLAPGAASGAADAPDRPLGRVDDACRRVLELATDPPPAGTAELWARQWLDAVLEAAATGPRRRSVATWAGAASLHPAVAALSSEAPGDDRAPTPEELARSARRLTRWRDWPVLRRSCAAGTWTAPDVPADVAGWLDDGAFARWVLGAYPELDDLCAGAVALLPATVATGIAATLLASGLLVER